MSKLLLIYGLLMGFLTGCNPYDASTTTFNPISAAPVATSTPVGTRQVQLTWSASPGLPTGYQVEQSTDNSSFTQIQQLGLVTSATIKGLSTGKIYYFRVRSFNLGGESPYSPTVTVDTAN